MNKSILFLILSSFGLVAALYSLPKIIVNSENKGALLGSANRDKSKTENTKPIEVHEEEDEHTTALTVEQQNQINKLKADYNNSAASNQTKAAENLIESFAEFQKFDSAAYYAEKLAIKNPTEKSWVGAADLYYQAFTFAVDNGKGLKMGEKSREYYQKALEKNPNLLLAKTNMAMTYVSTPTPMQGILLLREVVAQSPDFEPAVFNLGLLSMRSNQFSKAAERFKHLVNNNAKNTKAAFYLGVSLARLGRNAEAKEVLEKVKIADKDPAIQAEIAILLKELK